MTYSGFGDTTTKQVSAGCSVLLKTVQNKVKPKYHVFGHIHEGKQLFFDLQEIHKTKK